MRQGVNDGNWMKDIQCHEHLAKIAEGFDSLLKKGVKKRSEAKALERALCFGLRGGRLELSSILLISIALGFDCATQRLVEVAKAKGGGQLLGILSNHTDLARAAAECPNPSMLEFLAREVFADDWSLMIAVTEAVDRSLATRYGIPCDPITKMQKRAWMNALTLVSFITDHAQFEEYARFYPEHLVGELRTAMMSKRVKDKLQSLPFAVGEGKKPRRI